MKIHVCPGPFERKTIVDINIKLIKVTSKILALHPAALLQAIHLQPVRLQLSFHLQFLRPSLKKKHMVVS